MPKAQALKYVGPAIVDGGGVPLPQGYPAESHDEADADLAKEKLASKFYVLDAPKSEAAKPASDSPVTGGGAANE